MGSFAEQRGAEERNQWTRKQWKLHNLNKRKLSEKTKKRDYGIITEDIIKSKSLQSRKEGEKRARLKEYSNK